MSSSFREAKVKKDDETTKAEYISIGAITQAFLDMG
jgi:hypothetical protein